MSLVGIGTDLVQLTRIQDLLERYGERFVSRILSEEERKLFTTTLPTVAYLAKRFAGKEAVSKALGTGIGKVLSFQDISILNHPTGQPFVTLHGNGKALADQLKVSQIMISLSDEKDYALAFVVTSR